MAGIPAPWIALGLALIGFALGLTLVSPRFGYAHEVAAMPVLALAGGLVAGGIVFACCLLRLIRGSERDATRMWPLAAWVLAAGLAARLVLFASEPMLEDDYQRYLWDGAVTASGLNPFAVVPEEALEVDDGSKLAGLSRAGGLVLERINHPELRTVYPPVAQGAFALAYVLRPWSLAAWRSVILVCDLATLGLILLLLHACGRSPLWAALYWWNPVVLKELFNSAHMDAVVLPLVLLALWLAMRGRNMLAAGALAFAAGAKIWPVLLLPLIVRPLAAKPLSLVSALAAFGGLLALMAVPIFLVPVDETSGFAAYVRSWKTNSALFPMLESGAAVLLGLAGAAEVVPGAAARAFLAILLGAIVMGLSRVPIAGPSDLMGRASLSVAALVLLSPAQFPWYAVWFAPFLAFQPWTGFLVLMATVPLYYAGFHFLAREQPDVPGAIAWLVWLPVWAALAYEAAKSREKAVGNGQ